MKRNRKRTPDSGLSKLVAALSSDRGYLFIFIASIAFAALVLSPSLRTGFLGDDAINATLTPAGLIGTQQTLTGLVTQVFRAWVEGQGRFFPFAFYIYPLFYGLDGNRLLYKVLLLTVVLANLGVFSVFVRRVTRSNALGILAVVTPTLAFQYMLFHDSLLSFGGLLQLNWLFVLLSLILFVRYLENDKRSHLVLSTVLYASALLTYEIAIPFFALFVPLALFYPKRRAIRPALVKVIPLAAAAVASVTIALVLRSVYHLGVVAGQVAGPYQLSLKPVLVLEAFAKQLAGAIPLSYYTQHVIPTVTAAGGPPPTPIEYVTQFPLTSAIVFLGYAALIAIAMIAARTEPDRNQGGSGALVALTWIGAGLFVLPATLISLSSKWQGEGLAWGFAYLPVYVSYFGVAVLLALFVYWTARAPRAGLGRTMVTVAVAVTLAGVGVTNFQTNRLTVAQWGGMRYGRDIITNALDRGLLRSAPSDSLLVFKLPNSWDNREFYAGQSIDTTAVVQFDAVTSAQLLPLSSTVTTVAAGTRVVLADPNKALVVEYSAPGRRDGFAMVSEITTAAFTGEKLQTIGIRPIALYIETPQAPGKARDTFWGSPVDIALSGITPGSLGFAPAQVTKTSKGKGWALYKLNAGVSTYTPAK